MRYLGRMADTFIFNDESTRPEFRKMLLVISAGECVILSDKIKLKG
jgi:hypothetical protein